MLVMAFPILLSDFVDHCLQRRDIDDAAVEKVQAAFADLIRQA